MSTHDEGREATAFRKIADDLSEHVRCPADCAGFSGYQCNCGAERVVQQLELVKAMNPEPPAPVPAPEGRRTLACDRCGATTVEMVDDSCVCWNARCGGLLTPAPCRDGEAALPVLLEVLTALFDTDEFDGKFEPELRPKIEAAIDVLRRPAPTPSQPLEGEQAGNKC